MLPSHLTLGAGVLGLTFRPNVLGNSQTRVEDASTMYGKPKTQAYKNKTKQMEVNLASRFEQILPLLLENVSLRFTSKSETQNNAKVATGGVPLTTDECVGAARV